MRRLLWGALLCIFFSRPGALASRVLKSNIVVRSNQDRYQDPLQAGPSRRILVNVYDYAQSCTVEALDYIETSSWAYTARDYYSIEIDGNGCGDGDEWTTCSDYNDVEILTFAVLDMSGDDYASEVDVAVIDLDTGETLKSFSASSCVKFSIDAGSGCPGANIRIKTFCSSPGNCRLNYGYGYTTALCSPTPSSPLNTSPPDTPSPSDFTPSVVIPSPRSTVRIGAAVGGAIIGILSIGGGIATLIVRRKNKNKQPDPVINEEYLTSPSAALNDLPPPLTSDEGPTISNNATKDDSYLWATSPPVEDGGEGRKTKFSPCDTPAAAETKTAALAAGGGMSEATAAHSQLSASTSMASIELSSLGQRSASLAAPQDPLLQYVNSQLSTASGRSSVSKFSTSLELSFKDLQVGALLGEGSWGRVFKATYHETSVAVKVLLSEDKKVTADNAASLLSMSAPVLERLKQEASIMASLAHPHVVQFIGMTTFPPALVQEYCARGSVLGVLQAAAADPAAAAEMTWKRRLGVAIGTAKGVLFLHARSSPIVHRDLKSGNVLLSHNWTAKIADFGLAKCLEGSARSASLTAMNPRWLSPELLQGGSATPAADVFAFGVFLWELLTWKLPWGSTSPWTIVGSVCRGERLPIPPTPSLPGPECGWPGLPRYTDLLQRCWTQEADQRPDFKQIVEELRAMAPPGTEEMHF